MTARKPRLHAVGPNETPAPVHRTIEDAARADDVLSELRNTRIVIARKLDDPNCPARDMASLSKRLMEIGKEIAAILAREQESGSGVEVEDGIFDASAV